MKNCKKYKPAKGMAHLHHLNPTGDCSGCAFFSKSNCRRHGVVEPVSLTPV